MKRLFRNGVVICGAVSALILLMISDVQFRYLSRIHSPSEISNLEHTDIAMILGASVKPDNTPSDALRDRLLVGISLYKEGVVKRLLVTGDDGAYHANEIPIMKRFLIDNDIPDPDILVDGQGYRTYESCKRATEVLHLTKLIIVTQRFHIGRALYLCNSFGVDSVGVTSDLQTYQKNAWFWLRDIAASAEAWWDVNIWHPKPPVSEISLPRA